MRVFRVRSEWVTLATATGLAVCAWLLPKSAGLAPAKPEAAVAASGLDYSPVGAIRAPGKARATRRNP